MQIIRAWIPPRGLLSQACQGDREEVLRLAPDNFLQCFGQSCRHNIATPTKIVLYFGRLVFTTWFIHDVFTVPCKTLSIARQMGSVGSVVCRYSGHRAASTRWMKTIIYICVVVLCEPSLCLTFVVCLATGLQCTGPWMLERSTVERQNKNIERVTNHDGVTLHVGKN